LSASVKGSFTPAGAKLESVTPGSLFAKAGLKSGDVVTAVDGHPLRSLDDAANLYARAATARSVSLQITRAGKPMTLRIAIQETP
jgi:S1-C subfamily serine protease